jgi:hypothetical protein
LAFDASCARRIAELSLYLRQSHAERDLERLGALGQRGAAAGPGDLRSGGRHRGVRPQ